MKAEAEAEAEKKMKLKWRSLLGNDALLNYNNQQIASILVSVSSSFCDRVG